MATLSAYETILARIDALCQPDVETGTSIDLTLEELSSKERLRLYERIDVYCVGKLHRTRQDVFDGKRKIVTLKVVRVAAGASALQVAVDKQALVVTDKPLVVTDQMVTHFRKFTKLPLPINDAKLAPYYLRQLAPFSDALATWELFLQDVRTNGSCTALNGRINQVVDQIERHMASHPDMEAFRQRQFVAERAWVNYGLPNATTPGPVIFPMCIKRSGVTDKDCKQGSTNCFHWICPDGSSKYELCHASTIKERLGKGREFADQDLCAHIEEATRATAAATEPVDVTVPDAPLPEVYTRCANIYNRNNHDQRFISVDINRANFTVIKTFFPALFNNQDTWDEFLRSFYAPSSASNEDTPERTLHTLHFSKYLRERLFGNALVNKNVHMLSEYMIRRVLHDLHIPKDQIVMLSGDEVVCKYTPELFARLHEKYHGATFKVQAFRLVALGDLKFFVKEYFDAGPSACTTTKRELKCIPSDVVMQCIRFYQNEPVTREDLRFERPDGLRATFDEPLRFRH